MKLGIIGTRQIGCATTLGGNLGQRREIVPVNRSSTEAGDIVSWLIRNWHVADPRNVCERTKARLVFSWLKIAYLAHCWRRTPRLLVMRKLYV